VAQNVGAAATEPTLRSTAQPPRRHTDTVRATARAAVARTVSTPGGSTCERRGRSPTTPTSPRTGPDRPSWICPADGEAFPCAAYRAWVLGTFRDALDRSMHMSHWWGFAIIELPKPEVPGAIHQRFFGWIREPAEAPGPVRGRAPGGF
jgi:hypothetical protein